MQPSGPVQLGALLSVEKILFFPATVHKKEILRQLVRVSCPAIPAQEEESLAAQIDKREESVSTALPTGIALPHARVEGLKELHAALAVFKTPFPFSGGKKVRALLLFLSPADPAFFSRHLQFLGVCAQTFTAEFVHKLTCCRSAQEVASLFK